MEKIVHETSSTGQFTWIFLETRLIDFLASYFLHGLCCCTWASLVAASEDYSSLRCTGFSLQWSLLLWSSTIFLSSPWPQASPLLHPLIHRCHPPPCEDLGVGWHLHGEYKGSLSAGGSCTRQLSESNSGYLGVTHPRRGCSGHSNGKGTLSS